MGSTSGIVTAQKDFSNLSKKVTKAYRVAKDATVKEMRKTITEYVPYNTGRLSRNQALNANPTTITYDSCSYAKYAFNPTTSKGKPKKYNKSVNSKATGNPLETAKKENQDKWQEFFVKKFDEEMKK